MKLSTNGTAAILLAASLALAQSAVASPISTTYVRESGSFFAGMAVDSSTGAAYQLMGYGPGYDGPAPTSLTKYANAAAFEADTAAAVVNSAASLWGPYIAAQGGSYFGRTAVATDGYGWPNDANTSKFSGTTGAVQGTATVAGMGGENGSDTFNWGGFSGVNAMNDGSRLYVVGGTASNTDWQISSYDFGLNQLGSVTFSMSQMPGYGFSIGGYVFFGDSYNNGHISARVNATTGQVDAVDYTLTGMGDSLYLSNASYDAFNDTLYLHSEGNFYKVANASNAFDVVATPAPEPETFLLLGLGLIGLTRLRRTRR